MSNPFSSHSGGLSSPASRIVPITPDDDNDLPEGILPRAARRHGGDRNARRCERRRTCRRSASQGFNPIGARRVKTGGSAANLWALY